MARRTSRAGGVVALGLLLAAAWAAYFLLLPLAPRELPYEFTVHAGTSLRAVARHLVADGVLPEGESLWMAGRALGKDRSIQAGVYRLDRPTTTYDLLQKLARGDVVVLELVFPEGTTFKQWQALLAAEPRVRRTLAGTYRFPPGSSDVDILRRAHTAMVLRLDDAWSKRAPQTPLRTKYEALVLASIVEKETRLAEERPIVAAVFVNRLRRGMRLQTDPTVIYGMGENYAGNIRKKDLTTDTPWNTYTRDGLPPTPIAMPGAAALAAAAHPADAPFLYFVARGDGSHEFSRTLEEHNRAVARYQLKAGQ
jgi:peptidoglycan lytic transglycosylase G